MKIEQKGNGTKKKIVQKENKRRPFFFIYLEPRILEQPVLLVSLASLSHAILALSVSLAHFAQLELPPSFNQQIEYNRICCINSTDVYDQL